MTPWLQSLRGRVISVVLVATFVALAVATAALALYGAREYREALTSDLTTQAEILGRTNAPALVFDDPQAARENLALMRARPGILAAGIYKPSGELFASYSRPDTGNVLIPARPGPSGIEINNDEFLLVQPIFDKQERVGTVLIRAQYELKERLASYLVILIAVMAASLCVALLVSAFLQARITNPILSMTGVARKVIGERDFSLRVARTDTHEMDVLVDAFNEMLAEVGRQTEALAASNRSLESEMAERKSAEYALRAADRNKDQFLATLAHELRNPLAPLVNGITLLRLPPRPGAEPGKILDMMDRQIQQMVRLIDDLLDVSRIATNKLVLRKSAMELGAVVNAAVETVSPYLRQRKHTLEVSLPPDPIRLEGDATRLAQVFANLLHNAAKFTAPGGHTTLTVRSDERGIVATVKDSGVGIEARMLKQVFDLFEQADQSLERTEAGLGVGLSLAQRLVELHGGTLEARSEGLGKGSEFVVRLPPVAAAAVAEEVVAAAPTQGPASPHRVLIVDDNQDFAATLAMMLRSLGSDVRVASDAAEGLELAQRFVPEIAFLDIGMPRMNGYDLARQLRRLPALGRTMLVAVTGWGQQKDKQMAREAGFDHHLVKPVGLNDVESIMRGEIPPDSHGRNAEPT